jgi:hypothetical protein
MTLRGEKALISETCLTSKNKPWGTGVPPVQASPMIQHFPILSYLDSRHHP